MSELDSDDGDPIPSDGLDSFIEDVIACLNRREVITEYLTEVYARRAREDDLQTELNRFFEDEMGLARLFALSYSSAYSLWLSIDRAVDENLISDNAATEFRDFWETISWVDEAAMAFYIQDEFEWVYWTGKNMDIMISGDEVVVEHRMDWGISEAHDFVIPLDIFLDDVNDRVRQVASWLEDNTENQREITGENIEIMNDTAEQLAENHERLMKALEGFNIDGEN